MAEQINPAEPAALPAAVRAPPSNLSQLLGGGALRVHNMP